MAANALTPAVLQYIDHGAYPESEDVASAELGPDALKGLLVELRKEQDIVKDEIRSLSRSTAPDIDTWIARAKELQADIRRSRETARQIVREAEAGKILSAEVQDTGSKIALLEKEVAFNASLEVTLERLKDANAVLDQAQDEAVAGRIKQSFDHIQSADAAIVALGTSQSARAAGLLKDRLAKLKGSISETVSDYWNALITVNTSEKSIVISENVAEEPNIGIHVVVTAVTGLGTLDALLQRLKRDIDICILRPRMALDQNGEVFRPTINGDEIVSRGKSNDVSTGALFQDLGEIVDYLATRLPTSICVPLSAILIPSLSTRLIEDWLEPAVPLVVADMPIFQQQLAQVSNLAEQIDELGWTGAKELQDWARSAPRTWLTKRREAVLGDVRNLVFSGLAEQKTVERVETQVIKRDDELAANGQGDPDWDSAWDDQGNEPATTAVDTQEDGTAEDDEASAWELDEDDERENEGVKGDGEAWGWDDEDSSQQPKNPVTPKKPPPRVNGDVARSKPREREMTLRETYTVTAVPDGILEILRTTISDAETLASNYSSSPISPAATALYTVPTLALAIYRATASTAYTKAESGNMLIYNDATRLSEQLRAWQASQPPVSRLRLDGDVKALEQFAKHAYSAEMDSQRTILKDLLDGAQGFTNSTVPPFSTACEDAVAMTADRLSEVHRAWSSVLSNSALLQSLGSMLGTVTGKMMSEVEELGDISEPESQQLKKLCEKMSEAKEFFMQRREDGESADLTFIYCPNWLKFQYLAEILESSLADIKWMWSEGELSLEFGSEEVVELIESLFAESQLRRQAIQEVRRGGRS